MSVFVCHFVPVFVYQLPLGSIFMISLELEPCFKILSLYNIFDSSPFLSVVAPSYQENVVKWSVLIYSVFVNYGVSNFILNSCFKLCEKNFQGTTLWCQQGVKTTINCSK